MSIGTRWHLVYDEQPERARDICPSCALSHDDDCRHPSCARAHINGFTDAELRARDERIIWAAFDWGSDNPRWPTTDDLTDIIAAAEADS